jgi:hypothetical protein
MALNGVIRRSYTSYFRTGALPSASWWNWRNASMSMWVTQCNRDIVDRLHSIKRVQARFGRSHIKQEASYDSWWIFVPHTSGPGYTVRIRHKMPKHSELAMQY